MSNQIAQPKAPKWSRGDHDMRRDAGISRHRRRTLHDGGIRTHNIMRAQWVAERRLVAGAVVLAQIDYEDTGEFKTRPAIVVGRAGHRVVLVPCTSSDRAQRHEALELIDREEAGLSKRTFARRSRVMVERVAVVAVLGQLSSADLALLSDAGLAA